MSQTALMVKGRHIVIRTHVNPDNGKLSIVMANANDQFIGEKDDQIQVFEHDDPSEENFHKGLRKDAIAFGHFVAQHSTDPDWNEEFLKPKQE